MGTHEQIRQALTTMRSLAASADAAAPSAEAQAMARQLLDCYDQVVLPHHREEEREFWPMVARLRNRSEDQVNFVQAARRLQEEHAELEARWSGLQDGLRSLASGRGGALSASALSELAAHYSRHAQFEDELLVPLARHLLSPSEQSRLAVSVLLSRLPAAKWGMV
jgi:hemerythrin-like domain-containing protein